MPALRIQTTRVGGSAIKLYQGNLGISTLMLWKVQSSKRMLRKPTVWRRENKRFEHPADYSQRLCMEYLISIACRANFICIKIPSCMRLFDAEYSSLLNRHSIMQKVPETIPAARLPRTAIFLWKLRASLIQFTASFRLLLNSTAEFGRTNYRNVRLLNYRIWNVAFIKWCGGDCQEITPISFAKIPSHSIRKRARTLWRKSELHCITNHNFKSSKKENIVSSIALRMVLPKQNA